MFDPAHVHTTSYGQRAVCNPAFNPSPAPPPPPGTLVPGSSVMTSSPVPERFNGYGGSSARPGLRTRGMPRDPIDKGRSDKFKGWKFERSGRGYAVPAGTTPQRADVLDKEHELARICDIMGKQGHGPGQFCNDPAKFKIAAQLSGVKLSSAAKQRVDTRMPEDGFNPLLDRSSYNQLLHPLSQRSKYSVKKTLPLKPRRAGTPSFAHPGTHPGNLPPHTACSSIRSFATRSSVASAENKVLRAQNAHLESELAQLKGMPSGRSLRSHSTIRSLGSMRSTSGHALAAAANAEAAAKAALEEAFASGDPAAIAEAQKAVADAEAHRQAVVDAAAAKSDRMSVHHSEFGSRPNTMGSGHSFMSRT